MLAQTLCGRWRLVRLIGRGGMSAVYEARDAQGAPVAIKMLRQGSTRSAVARQRFLREGQVANAVAHAGAVRVLDEGETPDGHPFLVMELLEGRTLRAACDAADAPLDTGRVLEVAEGVLDVLAEAHAVGIVHRDIKPENIFLTADGDVKVLDFGIAALRDEGLDERSITQSGLTLGTPAFMAPEQARGRPSDVTSRTDLWAVGATMFFCFTRQYVHEGASNANEAIIFAATLRAPALSRLRPDLSSDVARIVDRALALEPAERWPSARAMRDAIAAVRERPSPGPRRRPPTGEDVGPSVHAPWTAETLDELGPRRHGRVPRGAIGWSVAGALAALSLVRAVGTGEAHPQRLRTPIAVVAPGVPVLPAPESAVAPPPALSAGAPTPVTTREAAPARPARGLPRAATHADGGSAPSGVLAGTPPASGLDVPDTILDRWK